MGRLSQGLCILVCGVTAACGGSSTGEAAFQSAGPITVSDVNGAGASYFDFAADSDQAFLSRTALEAQGSANFTGYMLAVPSGSLDALVGRTTINASFADGGQLTGDVTDLAFIAENTEVVAILTTTPADGFNEISAATALVPLDGELTLSDGTLSSLRGAGTVRVSVDGDVAIPGSLFNTQLSGKQSFDVTGSLLGLVAESGEFVADGSLRGRSQSFDLGLQAVIFAQ